MPFFKLALDSPPVEGDEVLLILNDEFTNVTLEVTREAHEAGKQALEDVAQDLLLLDDHELSSLSCDDERLLSHTLLQDIEQETKSDL